jgi:hypothetical protein
LLETLPRHVAKPLPVKTFKAEAAAVLSLYVDNDDLIFGLRAT